MGAVYLSTFLSAPLQQSETGTIRKRFKSTTEYVKTVGEGLVPAEKRALVCGPNIGTFTRGTLLLVTVHERISVQPVRIRLCMLPAAIFFVKWPSKEGEPKAIL